MLATVETNLGKGEVVSSILTGSTDKTGTSATCHVQNHAEQNMIAQGKLHQIGTKRSPFVHGGAAGMAGCSADMGAKEAEMKTEQQVYQEYAHEGLSYIGAVEALQKIGYSPTEAEDLVTEWADDLDFVSANCNENNEQSPF